MTVDTVASLIAAAFCVILAVSNSVFYFGQMGAEKQEKGSPRGWLDSFFWGQRGCSYGSLSKGQRNPGPSSAKILFARPRRLAALLLIQQLIHYLLAVAEIRAPESSEGIREVHQTAPRCQEKDAKRSGNLEPFAERHSGSFTLIDQNEIRVQ
jgi:hypothetical protein